MVSYNLTLIFMKPLETLVKLNKNKLDKILAEINSAEQEKTSLIIRKNKLIEEADDEINKYAISQYAYMLDQYLQNSRNLQKKIQAQIDRIDKTIEILRYKLSEQFAELKKFEIALANKKQKAQIRANKLETKSLDEINTNKFTYNKKF